MSRRKLKEVRVGVPKLGLMQNQLERYKRVLIYVSQAYPSMVHYLKGMHLILDSWGAG
jgi:hypothetical protein